MVQLVELLRVEEHVVLDVGGEGVVLVGVPQATRNLDELESAAVAGGVVEVLLQPEVTAGAGVEAGDHVPARATAADEVERREPARQVERRVVGRARGADEADV